MSYIENAWLRKRERERERCNNGRNIKRKRRGERKILKEKERDYKVEKQRWE